MSHLILWRFFILDRLTKWLVLSYVHQPIRLFPFVTIDVHTNRGISFGIFNGLGTLHFSLITALITGLLIVLYAYIIQRKKQQFDIDAETLIFIGGFSNLIDRFMYGAVIDFICISTRTLIFPIFNIADVLVFIGAFWMVYNHMQEEKEL